MLIPAISGPSMTWSGLANFCRASSVSASMKSTIPLTSACERRSSTGPSRQASSFTAALPFAFTVSANWMQPLGRVRPPVQEHVLDQLQQILRDLLVNRELPRVHDAHVQPRADGVVQERRVHRLAHRVVAAERERDVAHAAAHAAVRQVRLDPPRRVDERRSRSRCAPPCPSRR